MATAIMTTVRREDVMPVGGGSADPAALRDPALRDPDVRDPDPRDPDPRDRVPRDRVPRDRDPRDPDPREPDSVTWVRGEVGGAGPAPRRPDGGDAGLADG
jgi:hypothetical protein